jgi:hypothetical protein
MQPERISFWRRFIDGKSGATAVVIGLSLPMLVGFMGLGVEVGLWYLEKRELQEAADSAAIAGSREFVANSATQAQMEAAAAAAANKSGFASATQVLNQPPASGLYAIGGSLEDPTAVEVILTAPYSTYFVSLFGLDSVDIRARAVAVEGAAEAETEACILALAEDEPEICENGSTGMVLQGSLTVETTECSVHSNDSCGPSFDFNGNPTVNVDCMTYSGGLEAGVPAVEGDSNNLTLHGCGAPWYHEPIQDPYADAVIPANLGPCHANPNGTAIDANTTQFTPGYYCGSMPLQAGNNKTNILDPGVYFIEGDVLINGGTITGDDVILVLLDGNFDFRGNGDLSLIGPTAEDIYDPANAAAFAPILGQGDGVENPWDGLALYLNESSSLGETNSCPNKINGDSLLLVSGTIYGPDTCFVFSGNNTAGGADDPCFRIVAGNISLAGDVTMASAGCNLPGGGNITYGTMVGLVE